MDRTTTRAAAIVGALAALFAGLAAGAGVFLRGDLATTTFRTIRGELVEIVSDGVYRFNPEGIVAEGVGWDVITLFVIVPAMLVALTHLWRGSTRGALVSIGLLAYLAYQFFQYAVFWAYGPLYPLHVLTFALSISALGMLVHGLDIAELPAHVSDRFPHRAVAAYSGLVVLLLGGLWLPVIAGTLGGEVTDELGGASTLVVPAFDLGLLVPLAVFTAVTIVRRMPIGYLLGMLILVKGTSMALAIAAMLIVEWQVTGDLALPPLIIFSLMALLSVALGARALRAIEDGTRQVRPPRIGTPSPAPASG